MFPQQTEHDDGHGHNQHHKAHGLRHRLRPVDCRACACIPGEEQEEHQRPRSCRQAVAHPGLHHRPQIRMLGGGRRNRRIRDGPQVIAEGRPRHNGPDHEFRRRPRHHAHREQDGNHHEISAHRGARGKGQQAGDKESGRHEKSARKTGRHHIGRNGLYRAAGGNQLAGDRRQDHRQHDHGEHGLAQPVHQRLPIGLLVPGKQDACHQRGEERDHVSVHIGLAERRPGYHGCRCQQRDRSSEAAQIKFHFFRSVPHISSLYPFRIMFVNMFYFNGPACACQMILFPKNPAMSMESPQS